jgi:hypothetical protein
MVGMTSELAYLSWLGTSSAVSYDGLHCPGHLASLGETPRDVLSECGAPSASTHRSYKSRQLDVWTFERGGSFPRVLRFENGRLVSIARPACSVSECPQGRNIA